MKQMILRSGVFLCILIAFMGPVSNGLCSDIDVSNIRTLVVEKGIENYSVSVLANVTNRGESGNITLVLIALDMNGYQIKDVLLSGQIEQGKTKVLKAFIQIPKKTYEEIFKWEWKPSQ